MWNHRRKKKDKLQNMNRHGTVSRKPTGVGALKMHYLVPNADVSVVFK